VGSNGFDFYAEVLTFMPTAHTAAQQSYAAVQASKGLDIQLYQENILSKIFDNGRAQPGTWCVLCRSLIGTGALHSACCACGSCGLVHVCHSNQCSACWRVPAQQVEIHACFCALCRNHCVASRCWRLTCWGLLLVRGVQISLLMFTSSVSVDQWAHDYADVTNPRRDDVVD
jgi:hypothetical protein